MSNKLPLLFKNFPFQNEHCSILKKKKKIEKYTGIIFLPWYLNIMTSIKYIFARNFTVMT